MKISIFIQLVFMVIFFMGAKININPIIIEVLWLLSIFSGFITFILYKNKKSKFKIITFIFSITFSMLYLLGVFLDQM